MTGNGASDNHVATVPSTTDKGRATRPSAAATAGLAPGLRALLAPGAQLQRLAGGCTWSEGPAWLPDRQLLCWSDIPSNRVMQLDPATGRSAVYRADAEFTNGRAVTPDGQVVHCSHGRRAIEREVGIGTEILVDSWHGARLNSPNDLAVRSDGTIWFTDPPYGISVPVEGHPGEREYGDNFVFRLDPATGELCVVVSDMEAPNGIAFSPDESVVYVSDTSLSWRTDGGGNHHIRAYDVLDGRCAKNGRTLAVIERGLPDGFAVDVAGNIWTSSLDAVIVLAPDGSTIGSIPVPETIANLCFGGPDGTELFIAATTSIYRIATATRCATTVARAPR